MPKVKASLSVKKFVLLRIRKTIHPYNHDPSQGTYSYVMDNLTFWFDNLNEDGTYFISYYFDKINLHFYEEVIVKKCFLNFFFIKN